LSSPSLPVPQARTDLIAELIGALRVNSGHAVLMHARIGEQLGLAPSDHKALDLLQRFGPMTAGQLAGRTGLTSGAITGMLDRLERAGYARRARDPQDRRKVVIEPAPAGLPQLGAVFESLSQQTGALLNHYSDAELRLILDFLRRANAMMDAQRQPGSGGV
jgi:DNA-binding MarR family transcriptional regulator